MFVLTVLVFLRIFYGKIDGISYDPVTGSAVIKCADALRDILTEKITDFGTPEDTDDFVGGKNIGKRRRQFRLERDTSSDTLRGIYNLPADMLPIAEGSVIVQSDINTTLTEVQELRTSRELDFKRYKITDSGIESELPIPVSGTGYPQITCKSAYRWKSIEFLIKKLVDEVEDISTLDIVIPQITSTDTVFNRRGKVIHDLMNTESVQSRDGMGNISTVFGANDDNNPASLGGYVTDIIEDSGKLYIAYSVRRGDTTNFSLVLEYDPAAETYKVLLRISKTSGVATEIWRIAKSGSTIFILACNSKLRTKDLDDLPDVDPHNLPISHLT